MKERFFLYFIVFIVTYIWNLALFLIAYIINRLASKIAKIEDIEFGYIIIGILCISSSLVYYFLNPDEPTLREFIGGSIRLIFSIFLAFLIQREFVKDSQNLLEKIKYYFIGAFVATIVYFLSIIPKTEFNILRIGL